MNNKEKTDLAELFVIEFERYPRDWTRGEMYTEARRIIDLYYESRATPPLAPCEPSAEPSVDVDNLVNFVTSYIDNRSAMVPQGPGPVNPWNECRSSAANAIRDWFDPMKGARSALFVKEKLT